MNPLLQTLRNLGPARLAAMGAVLVGLIAFFIFIAGRLSTPGMALLYSSLSSTDAAQIVQQLESQKIPYELSSDGSAISVPAPQVPKLRMQTAAAGLPRGGSIGYEIFDQPEGFGTTSFVQSINHLRALEGELARTIGTLAPVQQARVHLVLPQRELFGRTEQKATASVFLRLRGGSGLSKENIVAIENLVAAAVPALEPNQISIVDDRGNLLARAVGNNPNATGTTESHDDMRLAYEGEQAQKIEDLLGKTLGFGRVRAQVSADMDFDRVTTNSESYDPDGQVVRSTQTTSETSNDGSDSGGGSVSITNNLPGGSASSGGGAGASKNSRTEETTNYEISKTIKSQVRESGNVKRLSVAVLVDGEYDTDKEGKQTYKPRSDEDMKQITALVRSAINYDEKRGDTLQVTNMRFIAAENGDAAGMNSDQLFGFPKADIMQLAQTLILAVVALLVVLLVVRPLLKRMFEVTVASMPEGGMQKLLSGTQPAALAPPTGALAQSLTAEQPDAIDQLIDISRVEGRVRASAVKKVGEIIDKHPEESVSVLRNWMTQDSR